MILSVNKVHNLEPPTLGIVHILDEQPAFRSQACQWAALLGHQPVIYQSHDEFLTADHVDSPACLILDFTLGDACGMELQARFKREKSSLPFVFIASRPTVRQVVVAMEQGAVTVLERPCSQAQFAESVTEAITRDSLARRLSRRLDELRQRFEHLNPREKLVMNLVVEGRLNKAIARELKMTERTVERVRAVVLEKVRADSAVQMASLLTEHRVLDELLCETGAASSEQFEHYANAH